MKLKKLPYDFTVCQVASAEDIALNNEFSFIAKTDEELSLVCKTADTPEKIGLLFSEETYRIILKIRREQIVYEEKICYGSVI